MEQLVDLVNKIFQKQSTAIMVGIIGVAAAFFVIIICGSLIGDFIKAKRALKLVAIGQTERGLERLEQIIVAKDGESFCYATAVTRPYDYSLTKKMPTLMLVSTAFCTGLSLFASLSLSGIFTGYTIIAFLMPGLLGLALCALALAIRSSMLKTATLDCYKAAEMIKNIPVTEDVGSKEQYGSGESAGRQYGASGYSREYGADSGRDEDALPAEIISLCARIEEVALEGGADHRTLSALYSEIKGLQQKANTPQAEAKLAAALEVLIVLVDSAL